MIIILSNSSPPPFNQYLKLLFRVIAHQSNYYIEIIFFDIVLLFRFDIQNIRKATNCTVVSYQDMDLGLYK